MPKKCIAMSTGFPATVAKHPVEELAGERGSDWWRQIDRWVNEGGAEKRTTTPSSPQTSRSRRR